MWSFLFRIYMRLTRRLAYLRAQLRADDASCFPEHVTAGWSYWLTKNLVNQVIAECQRGIAKFALCPFYTLGQVGEQVVLPPYRNCESFYWGQIPQWLALYACQHPIRTCLDVGCGYGTLALYARKLNPECQVCLIDFTDVYISPRLLKKYRFRFTRMNIELESIPYIEKFDVILFTEILEHFNFNPLPTLRKLHQALADDGILLLSTPNAERWGRLDYYAHWTDLPAPNSTKEIVDAHIYQYTRSELQDLLDQAGFVIAKMDYSGLGQLDHFNLVCRKKSG